MAHPGDPRSATIGIIGAGTAGLITAYTLLQDGFTNVELITRDRTAGGVWAAERIYPGLQINNVHGEFRFSHLPMAVPENAPVTGGRLCGTDLRTYMETFADKYLKDRVRFQTEVHKVRRDDITKKWVLSVEDKRDGSRKDLVYSRIVLCTGGVSKPYVPSDLSPAVAKEAGFSGFVMHASDFGPKLDDLLVHVKPVQSDGESDAVVVVGGGKSAQDISAYLAGEGRKVYVVFETVDAYLAAPKPLPDHIRKGRLLSIISPHIHLRTRLERFLHTTWLGAKIVKFIWNTLTQGGFDAYKLPKDSPIRFALSPFWTVRTNDEGVVRDNGFHGLIQSGVIEAVAPARLVGYEPGRVVLSNGRKIAASAVVLGTGYASSWSHIFDEDTANELGLWRDLTREKNVKYEWKYTTLANPPPIRNPNERWTTAIYRGLVPAKNIERRDFATNGLMLTPNNGYAFEVASHWISSYFLGDKMRIPATSAEAVEAAEREAQWVETRFPNQVRLINEGYAGGAPFWTWPQYVDDLLEDMNLPCLRSGGNWFNWPVQVIDLKEISTLGEERRKKRFE